MTIQAKSQQNNVAPANATFHNQRNKLLLPAWLVIGFFLVVPVLMMLVYSFLTKEFYSVLGEPANTHCLNEISD